MSYKGPDISAWQGDIDIKALSPQVDLFIFRVYAGSSKDKKVDRNVNLAIECGKPYGLYIYSYALNTAQAQEEAERVIATANSYAIKPTFLCIDMEDADGYKRKYGMPSNQTLKDICTVECKAFENAGYYAMIYASTSWFNNQLAGLNDYDKWVAHWPVSGGKQTGNNTNPNGENASRCGIWQFTSEGTLNGYNGRLDMNYIYKDILVNKSSNPTPIPEPTPTPIPTPSGSTLELVADVMDGKYGEGETRKNNLGTRYNEVQDFINHIYSASVDTLVQETKAGKYGNGDIRKKVLGDRYNEVQNKINKSSGGTPTRYYIVQPGDTLSGIGYKLGVNWKTIASKNGIKSPYIIYPGQKLKY